MADMGRILKTEYPSRRIATRQAPVFVVRLVALWDGAARAILPKLGHIGRVSNGRAVEILGMEFIAPATALKASAEALLRFGILR
jgi:dihydroflavonol-4-reductase